MFRPLKIAICGGVCGGKTSSLPFVQQQLESRGLKVYTVPEVATLYGNAGLVLGEAYSKSGKTLQTVMLKTMLELEDSFMQLATMMEKPAVILSDRGAMDARAFTFPPVWEQILRENEWTNLELQSRYDAVFYMITAADGARQFYGNKTNKIRSEDAKNALENCQKNRMAWLGHPHLKLFDNSTNFATKLSRLCASVDHYLDSIETERRFLVKSAHLDIPVETVMIEQVYLKSSDERTERIRKRGNQTGWVYTRTTKEKINDAFGSSKEIETPISGLEYEVLKQSADPARRTIFKKRNYFIWENQYFELDEFIDPFTGTLILEIELDSPTQEVLIPPFIKVDKEITDDPTYSNRAMAKLASVLL